MSGELVRNDKGQFVKGHSGNPEGKPVGLRNKSTAIKEFIEHATVEQLEQSAEDIMNTAIRMAKGGDRAMIKLLLGDMLSHVRGEETQKAADGAVEINISLMSEPGAQAVTIDQNQKEK